MPPNQPKSKKQRVTAAAGAKLSDGPGTLQCTVCSRQFSRPSHHDRHYRTHLPPEGRLALPCGRCGKTFGRNDVLLRHLRTAHGIDPGPQPRAAQKSCYRCVQLRRKCDRAQPCRLCAAGGAVCQYPIFETASQKTAAMLAHTSPESSVVAQQQHPAPPTMVMAAENTIRQEHLFQESGGYHQQPDFNAGILGPGVLDVTGNVPTNGNGASYLNGNGSVAAAGCSPSFSDEHYPATDGKPFVASLSNGNFPTAAGMDWLDFDVPDMYAGVPDGEPNLAHQPPPPPPPYQQDQHYQQRQQEQQHRHQQESQHPMDRPPSSHYASYPATTAPGFGNSSDPRVGVPHVGGPHASGPQASPTTVLPWPFDDTSHDLAPHRLSLPPLREVLQNTLLQSTNPTPPNKSTMANLVALMSDTRMPSAVYGTGEDSEESSAAHPSQQLQSTSHASSSQQNSANTAMSMSLSMTMTKVDPGMAHAANILKHLVDTYVTKFQPILPLLHIPTWDLVTCPPVLVSAMACVGSLLADDERVTGLTWSISEICMPMIAWLGSSDSTNYRDISYLSALCVHQIYSLGSGNRQLYQNADRSRGILVGGLRGMGCLTTRLSLEDKLEQEQQQSDHHQKDATATRDNNIGNPFAAAVPTDSSMQHEQWMAWMRREREKRTAWSSFEYDCSLCTLTGRRGAVDLSELPSRLPCAETLWDAPSATAWAALRTRLHPDALGSQVSLVLKVALSQEEDDDDDDDNDDNDDNDSDNDDDDAGHHDEEDSDSSEGHSGTTYVGTDGDSSKLAAATAGTTTSSPQVSFWGKRLCAQVVGRLLWDLKQLETLSTSEYFGMPSLSTANAANKVRLLGALDNLLVSMDQPSTVADLISYNIASLIGHYCHLVTAQDVLDIMLYIVRNTVAHGARTRKLHHKGIQMAKRRLVATLSRDPKEARRLVYHAAQIVAVANDYLVSAPCEILRLFMGYTFLIVFSAYCPSSHRFQIDQPPSAMSSAASTPIQLDIPSHRIASTSDVDNWIAHGGPAAIGSVPNLFAVGSALAISRDAQAMLQRLRCWGLAEKFVKILQSFESTMLVETT